MAASNAHSYSAVANESLSFPWPNLEVLLELNCNGVSVTPEVHAKVEKGFFLSTVDGKWTCYRRNYFSVNCNYELHPNVQNAHLTIKRNNVTERVQAMGMRLTAVVDGSQGKSIELVQHTPKRDNGPKNKIDVTKVCPAPSGRQDSTISPHGVYQIPMQTYHPTGQTPGPNLPLQNTPDDGSPIQSEVTPASHYGLGMTGATHVPTPGSATAHTFERVQFKQATANNGKRRASQQYFHLVVELFVDIRKTEQDTPSWVKIAQRVSEKIVVRGRSPSHYQNEGQSGTAGKGGAAGPNGGYSVGGASFGGMNQGGFRSSGSHYSGSISGGSNGYRSNHYGLNMPNDHPGSHSGSSSSSIDGGPVDGYQVDTVMSDADRIAIHEHDGYQYYPSTIYEGMATQLPPLGKIESNARYSTEPRQYAVKAEYSDAIPGAQFSAGSIGRFQGVESSRGYYPDLQTGCN
jgi:meiosis-specific transcription factor NDT80